MESRWHLDPGIFGLAAPAVGPLIGRGGLVPWGRGRVRVEGMHVDFQVDVGLFAGVYGEP
jgi:hypothetical protein